MFGLSFNVSVAILFSVVWLVLFVAFCVLLDGVAKRFKL